MRTFFIPTQPMFALRVPRPGWQSLAATASKVMALAVVGVVWSSLTAMAVPASAADVASSEKVYELRTYTTNPGKLEALKTRFRDHTCRLFKKHGIELVGFWTPTSGPEAQNTLTYIIAFPSVEAQKKMWQEFRDDPEWKTAKAASEKNGVIVNNVQTKNLKATDFSPIR